MPQTDGRLPREVSIASISQEGLQARSVEEMVGKMLERMEAFVPMHPDIVCLPEAFPYVNLASGRLPAPDRAESPPGPVSEPFADFARRHGCYVICPITTREDGRFYNAAVLFDRAGEMIGEYRKTRLTMDEMAGGLTPGPVDPPVFTTDFGTIGIQICFDIEWLDGWRRLREKRAEIVFWPSAFAGGQKLNMLACLYHYVVVSSTRKSTTKIVDISGEEIASTGMWDPKGVCAPVNLDKAFLHTWPHQKAFEAIRARYGRRISIRTYHEEEWTVIESRSPEVKVADVIAEFDLETYENMVARATAAQTERRPAPE